MSTLSTLDMNGGPAFPRQNSVFGAMDGHPGMSIRDYFAGQALAGICAQDDGRCWHGNSTDTEGIRKWRAELADADAEYCFVRADAMIKHRNKTNGGNKS